MKNWKTTLMGLLVIGASVISAPKLDRASIASGILTGVGLIVAQDSGKKDETLK